MGPPNAKVPFVSHGGIVHYHDDPRCKEVFELSQKLSDDELCPECGRPFVRVSAWSCSTERLDGTIFVQHTFYSDIEYYEGEKVECPVCKVLATVITGVQPQSIPAPIGENPFSHLPPFPQSPPKPASSPFHLSNSVNSLLKYVFAIVAAVGALILLILLLQTVWRFIVYIGAALASFFAVIPGFLGGVGQSIIDIAQTAFWFIHLALVFLFFLIAIGVAIYLLFRLISIVLQASVVTLERQNFELEWSELSSVLERERLDEHMKSPGFDERVRFARERLSSDFDRPDFAERYAIVENAVAKAVTKERSLLERQQVVTGLLIVVICFGALLCYTSVESMAEFARLLQRVITLGAANVLFCVLIFNTIKFFSSLDQRFQRLPAATGWSIIIGGAITLTTLSFALLPGPQSLRGDDITIQLVLVLVEGVVVTGIEIFGSLLWERPIDNVGKWISQSVQWLKRQASGLKLT